MKVQGIQGVSVDQIKFEVQQGGKFVIYYYTISVLIMTFRRSSDIHFIRHGESAVARGLKWTLLTFLAGWWGIPWGPIYSIQSIVVNCRGGKDVTAELLPQFQPVQAAVVAGAS